MSQEELASALKIKRSKLSAIENGQTKSPPFEDVINLLEFFKNTDETEDQPYFQEVYELEK